MLRSDLIATLARDHPELGTETAERIVASFFEAIAGRLARGGRVELRRFGVFSTRAREARKGRNPRTGADVAVEAKRALHFRPAKELKLQLDAKNKRPPRRASARAS